MEAIYVDYNIYMGSFIPQVMFWWNGDVSQFILVEDYPHLFGARTDSVTLIQYSSPSAGNYNVGHPSPSQCFSARGPFTKEEEK